MTAHTCPNTGAACGCDPDERCAPTVANVVPPAAPRTYTEAMVTLRERLAARLERAEAVAEVAGDFLVLLKATAYRTGKEQS